MKYENKSSKKKTIRIGTSLNPRWITIRPGEKKEVPGDLAEKAGLEQAKPEPKTTKTKTKSFKTASGKKIRTKKIK